MQLVVGISEDTFFDLKKKQNRTEVDNAILNSELYETRLKADMVAMLEELQLQMEEYEPKWVENDEQAVASCRTWEDLDGIIQQKIDKLKGEQDGNDD